MRNSSPLITCSGVLLSKNKYKTCRHSLEFTSNRKIYNLYFWGVREKRASIRLSLLTCLVWSRLHSAKIKSQFCFSFLLVCQATLFDDAFAEISTPQFPILPTVLLERTTPACLGHKSQKRGHGVVFPENKKESPRVKSHLFIYITLKVPWLKCLSICKDVYTFPASPPRPVSVANTIDRKIIHWVSVTSDYRMNGHYLLTFTALLQ